MKNRLTLLALAVLCYGHMQAVNSLNNIRSSIHSYMPYNYCSNTYKTDIKDFKKTPVEDIAKSLSELEDTYEVNVSNDYVDALSQAISKKNKKADLYLGPLESAKFKMNKLLDEKPGINRPFKPIHISDPFRYYYSFDSYLKSIAIDVLASIGINLVRSYYDYTPEEREEYEQTRKLYQENRKKYATTSDKASKLFKKYTTLKSHLNKQNQPKPEWLYFQHPNRNILGEY